MLDFLYYLFIAPLEAGMSATLHGAHALTGDWGFSLVLLSLAVNAALIPVYHLAETWQEAERGLQRAMAPKLSEINQAFLGRERYMYTRALYRLYGYSPVFALRTSLGLLIQIPFFFAAYHLLNNEPALAGQSWLFIADLAKPDGLVRFEGHVLNLLPFVMTAANLLSAAVYTARLDKREKVQLYGLAALFLLLLYWSSAALLVYWTCNNLFSLVKNVVYTALIYKRMEKKTRFGLTAKDAPARPHAYDGDTRQERPLPTFLLRVDIILGLLCAALFTLCMVVRKRRGADEMNLTLMGAALGLGLLALVLRLLALSRGAGQGKLRGYAAALTRHYGLFALIVGAVVSLCIWKLTSYKKLADAPSWCLYRGMALCIGAFTAWAFARQPLQRLFCRVGLFAESRLEGTAAASLFAASALVLAALVCWFTPASLFASDPDFFYESLGALLGRLSFRGMVFLALCALLFRLAHARLRPLLALTWAWATVAALLFTFVAAGDYGTMDEFILQDPALLKTRLGIVVDLAVAAAAALLLAILLRGKRARLLTGLLQGVAFALGLMTLYLGISAPAGQNIGAAEASVRLPAYNDELFGFTRTGKNALVVMLDMFTGGHMENILTQSPELKQKLDGFVWYPDTLAPGATTLLSIGALLGGENFTAEAINERRELPLKEELHRAFAVLPDVFVPRGYSVALADVDELIPELFAKSTSHATDTLVVGKPLTTAYTGFWRSKQGLPSPLPESRAPFLAGVGLFRAAPWVLRGHIYGDGNWMGTQTVVHNPSEGAYALLDVLPQVSNAEQGNSTVKFVASQVAHYPWRLDEKTCMPTGPKKQYAVGDDRVIFDHVVNERCGLLALARWFEWMRRAGVYDNTQIILVSDHDGNDAAAFGAAFDDLRPHKTPWKPHALLLVKQRNSRGPLRTDKRPMSAADVLPLICAADGPCPGVEYADPLKKRQTPRVRVHSSGMASIRRHGAKFFETDDFRVTGSMFDRGNWEKLEKQP